MPTRQFFCKTLAIPIHSSLPASVVGHNLYFCQGYTLFFILLTMLCHLYFFCQDFEGDQFESDRRIMRIDAGLAVIFKT